MKDMAITAQLVKELREKTGAGMMDCKKALSESDGDMDAAVEYLRKKGLQAASRKQARTASEGAIMFYLADNQKQATLVEINCETDFVAKNDDFVGFASEVAQLVADQNPDSVDTLLQAKLSGGDTVEERINLLVSKIGEKITVRRFISVSANDNEKIGAYIHTGSKIGVLVKLTGNGSDDDLVKDVAMHVAAAKPLYLNKDNIPQDTIDKEKEIYTEQLKAEGKPDNVIDKILVGKINKFSNEICLNQQMFIKDPTGKKSVSQMLTEKDSSLAIVSFNRYEVGEGIEKKQDDFASEVAKMAQ